MLKQNLELNRFGLSAMPETEMMEVDGGSFWSWIGGAVALVGVMLSGPVGAIMLIAGITIWAVDQQNNPSPSDPTIIIS